MNITKYTHACLVLEKDNQSLVIDPGEFSADFSSPTNVVGVVITHDHMDHLDTSKLNEIITKNPDALIYGHQDVVSQIKDLPTQTVDTNESIHVGDFTLKFVGGEHAIIHGEMGKGANLGVIVDDEFYYPGDSFSLPGQDIDTLAVPIAGPWMKLGEAIDFIKTVKPKNAFPTHDAIHSDGGKKMADDMVDGVAKSVGTDYKRI